MHKREQVILRAAIGAMAAALVVMPAHADEAHGVLRTISVSAVGSVQAEPDTAMITTGVESQADTAREALARNSVLMSKVIDGLRAAGLDAKDIQTSALQLNPRYQNYQAGVEPKIVGYTASNQVHLTLHDVTRVGDILDKAVTLGANRINGISFRVSRAEELEDEARTRAMKNARRRAELYAAAGGVTLGPIVTISESIEASGPVFVGAPMAKAVHAAPPPPVEAGQQRLDATIHVTWEVK